jgi:hypothetical protein
VAAGCRLRFRSAVQESVDFMPVNRLVSLLVTETHQADPERFRARDALKHRVMR